MSFRDIATDPRLGHALRELQRKGIYGAVERVRRNYAIVAFDVLATANYIITEELNRLKKDYVKGYVDKDDRAAVFAIELPDYEAVPEPEDVLRRTEEDISERLRRRGIPAVAKIEDERHAYVAIDLVGLAHWIGRQARATMPRELRSAYHVDEEELVTLLHLWTGPTPEEVKGVVSAEED
mgnify:CR=1 FL=1